MASEQLDAAVNCWKSGDLAQAAVLFRQIAATGDPEASHLLAGLLHEQGDLDGAEAAHRSVIQSGDPVFGQRSAIAMGMMLVNAKEWPAAHRVLMIASDGADFEVAALADTALVLVCTQLGDAPGAQEALERARRCDSPAVGELAARLELPEFHQDPASARELYEAAVDEEDYRALLTCGDPDVVALSAFRLYQQYAEAEEFERARQVCEHAIAVGHADHQGMAHKLLGAVLVDLGEYAESAAAYRVAAEDLRPDVRLPALIELAKVTAQLGDVAETKAIFQRVIASGQREYALQARACLAQIHTEAGEAGEALAALRAVLEAGESEWASICVTLLSLLLEQHADRHDEIIELAAYASEHAGPDAAFKAALLVDHAARQQPLADPVEEQALQDTDAGLARLQAGDLAGARRLLRLAADSGAQVQSIRAMVTLAELELGEGDREQADELLSYVAECDDVAQAFNAAFLLHLVRERDSHPVLGAMLAHQRLGREEGLARYRAAMDHADPAVSAIGTAVLAQVLAAAGLDLSDAAGMFRAAAGSGDPLALSYTAVICKDVLADQDEAIELLRRARADGHPALAPFVAYALGGLVAEHVRDQAEGVRGEVRGAYREAFDTGCGGLRFAAAGALAGVCEEQGDLLAACRVYERLIAEGAPERAAWPLGFTRVRLGDFAAARAAFALAPGEMGEFGRLLLDQDFDAAAEAFPEGEAYWMASTLAMRSAHAWQRAGRRAAADGALTLVATAGHPDLRQEAGCYLGSLRDDAGDRRGAVAAWRQAVGADDRLNAIALSAAGTALRDLGEHAEAAEALTRLAGTSEDPDVVLRLAEALVACGRREEARERLAGAFGADAAVHHARMLREHGDPEGALAALTEAPYEVSGESERLLGGLLAATGDLRGARAAFERAAAVDPGSEAVTMLEAGRCLLAAGDTESAHFALERAAAQDDDDYAAAAARHLLGRAVPEELPWVLAESGDRQGALAALTAQIGSELLAGLLLALDEEDVPAVRRLLAAAEPAVRAEVLPEVTVRAQGMPGHVAEPLFLLAVELGEPEHAAQARLGLGALLANQGEHCGAELCLLPATEHPRAAGAAWRDIAVVRSRRGDLDGAVEAAEAGLPGTAVLLAGLLADRGDTAGARGVLVGGASGGDLECLRRLLVHLLQEGDYDALEIEAERAAGTGDPETVALGYWSWGDAYKLRGDMERAALMYGRGVETGFAETTPGLRADLAGALRELGDADGAAREARLALTSGEPDAVARGGVMLGLWLHEEGDHLAAARAFAEAAATGTDLAQTALKNLDALAYQAARRGEHPLAVQVLTLMGQDGAEPARELGDLCEDPAAVRGYYEVAGTGPFTELRVAERLAELGETAEARAMFERLNEHDDPDVRFVAGGRLLALLDSEGDSDAFYTLAERQAGDADSPVQGVFGSLLGMLQDRQGDTEQSLRTLRTAAESGEPTALSVFAQALVRAGEVDEGRQVYLRVLDAGDADLAARAMVALGQTYDKEDESRARDWYVRAVEAGEGHTSALGAMYLGALAKRNRDFPEALTWYQRVIDAGDSESGLAAAHLGELCYWLGDRDGALRFYELTLGLTEQTDLVAEAAYRLGEIRYARGDLDPAKHLLAKAAATGDPTFTPEAESLLAKLR
ncbi:tetratricopeptide repeat protein [Nonomuraea sp. K274]|uniref:Tetratricopeptide repeat protein n=1 Tax=Nonomuraea cypriaca TaxID=1187855 RepID=A0A931AFA5_9ACTN|nr:tetratricopeptide repeat protein [Nonomuraea cypriaca]MBF8190888.1 tetratricopeptide repeat protein [Nonomuraea cypriaca]